MLTIKGRGAIFSKDRVYRYALWRVWKPERGLVLFICLNPSTADETEDDPTVRRCAGYTGRWGHGGVIVCNLFAFRATRPDELTTVANPIGRDNNKFILKIAQRNDVRRVVLGWGNHGMYQGRSLEVIDMLEKVRRLECLRTTGLGQPTHPLYLPRTLRPRIYRR